ncbi:PopZ family protein [Aliihoeflea sp. PC F10.4]
MAQASSAQREPSMEEILASIRRIIEDSDTGKKPAAFDGDADLTAGEIAPPVLEPANSDVVSFRRPAPVEERGDHPAEADAAENHDVVSDEETSSFSGLQDGDDQFDLPDDFAADFEELQAALDQGLDEQATSTLDDAEEAELERAAAHAPLVSETTGRQVAAAFGELSDAFAASRRKSFDEMAEEMLRPMLQDWLDDNLPTLVERLVREEIERVARAGSR